MKFSCFKKDILKSILIVSKVISVRTTIPALQGFLLNVEKDNLKIIGSDLNMSIETNLKVNSEIEGKIIVSSKLFLDILRKLPEEEIFFELKNTNLIIKTSISEFKIGTMPYLDFPEINFNIKTENEIIFDKDLFIEMIEKTSFAASIDESKGIAVGVLLKQLNDKFETVAIDGARVAINKRNIKSNEENEIVIPAKMLNDVVKILKENNIEEELKLYISNERGLFKLKDTKIIVNILKGKFIQYESAIPKEIKTNLKINRESFLESLDRVSLLAREGKNNLIIIKVKNNLMEIESKSNEGEVKEDIFIEKEGEDVEIGFNLKFIIDSLKVINDEKISFKIADRMSPALITAIEEESDFTHIIVPVNY